MAHPALTLPSGTLERLVYDTPYLHLRYQLIVRRYHNVSIQLLLRTGHLGLDWVERIEPAWRRYLERELQMNQEVLRFEADLRAQSRAHHDDMVEYVRHLRPLLFSFRHTYGSVTESLVTVRWSHGEVQGAVLRHMNATFDPPSYETLSWTESKLSTESDLPNVESKVVVGGYWLLLAPLHCLGASRQFRIVRLDQHQLWHLQVFRVLHVHWPDELGRLVLSYLY